MDRLTTSKKFFLVAVIALSYVASGLFGLSFAIPGTNATPLWPPAGIALAAMVVFGWEAWVGVLTGALLTNALHFAKTANIALAPALGGSFALALGNVLEASVAYYFCLRCMEKGAFLKEVNCVFNLVPITAIACFFAAFVGSLTMVATGQADLKEAADVFATWWLGDGLALLVLTPFLTSFWPLPTLNKNYRWFELCCAYLSLCVLCYVVFCGDYPVMGRTAIFLPVLVWLAFRFTRRELLSAVCLISLVAIYATGHGRGPFVSPDLTDSILAEQLFCAIIALVMLALSVMVSKNEQYRESLQQANEELEEKVSERTLELEKQTRILKAINSQLVVEARERSAAEKRLEELQTR